MRRIAAKCSIPVIIVNTVTWTQYNNKISNSKLFLLSKENPPLQRGYLADGEYTSSLSAILKECS